MFLPRCHHDKLQPQQRRAGEGRGRGGAGRGRWDGGSGASHGKGLAGACLAIGEDGAVEALSYTVGDALYLLVDLTQCEKSKFSFFSGVSPNA